MVITWPRIVTRPVTARSLPVLSFFSSTTACALLSVMALLLLMLRTASPNVTVTVTSGPTVPTGENVTDGASASTVKVAVLASVIWLPGRSSTWSPSRVTVYWLPLTSEFAGSMVITCFSASIITRLLTARSVLLVSPTWTSVTAAAAAASSKTPPSALSTASSNDTVTLLAGLVITALSAGAKVTAGATVSRVAVLLTELAGPLLPATSRAELAPTVTTRSPLFPAVVNVPVYTLPCLAVTVLPARLAGLSPPSTVTSPTTKPVTTSVNSKVATISSPEPLNAAGTSVIVSPGATAS